MGYLTTASTTWGSGSYFDYANFTSAPASKYYDAYTSDDPLTACDGGICYGQALSETSGWYNSHSYFVFDRQPWLIRGGAYAYSKGLFHYDMNITAASFRSVFLMPGV